MVYSERPIYNPAPNAGGPVNYSGTADNSIRYTVSGVISRSSMAFGAVVFAAVAGWAVYNSPALQGYWLPLLLVSVIGALVLGIWDAVSRKGSAVRTLAYSAFQGLALGFISAGMERFAPGIVIQAVLATVAVFVAILLLFRSGVVRVSARANRIFLVALVGYAVFGIFNLLLLFTGLTDNPFGLYGATIHGIPIGLGLSVLAIALGSYSLVRDFDETTRRAQRGDSQDREWKTALSFVATMVWLYLEILRLLAIVRR